MLKKKIISILVIFIIVLSSTVISRAQIYPLPQNYNHLSNEAKIKVIKELIFKIKVLINKKINQISEEIKNNKQDNKNLLMNNNLPLTKPQLASKIYYHVGDSDFRSIYQPVLGVETQIILFKKKDKWSEKNLNGFFMIDEKNSAKSTLENDKYLRTWYIPTHNKENIKENNMVITQHIKRKTYAYTKTMRTIVLFEPMTSLALTKKMLYWGSGYKDIDVTLENKYGNKATRFTAYFTRGIRANTAYNLVAIFPETEDELKNEYYLMHADYLTNGDKVLLTGN